MATNTLPKTNDLLFALATDMIDGLTAIGDSTGIVQNTATVLQTVLDDAKAAEQQFQAARQQKITAIAAQSMADAKAKTFIATAKRVLIPLLGAAWSTAWVEVGFVNTTLATPTSIDERYSLLDTLRAYLAKHPEQENAPLLITAATAATLHADFKSARAEVKSALTALGISRDQREKEITALRTRMRGLIAEITTLLPDDDPRWYQFGLNAPADPETPTIPEAPILTPGTLGSGLLFLDWPDTRRTDRYRVWQKLPTDTAFTPVATVTESDATLDSLPTGILLEFQITALNEAGESIPSPVSSITL